MTGPLAPNVTGVGSLWKKSIASWSVSSVVSIGIVGTLRFFDVPEVLSCLPN